MTAEARMSREFGSTQTIIGRTYLFDWFLAFVGFAYLMIPSG
jgi:hypothetical protein